MDKRRIIVPVIMVLGIAIYLGVKGISGSSNDAIAGSGTIEVTQVDISSKIMGKIDKMPVEEGSRVSKDSLIVELAHEELNAQLAQSKASLLGAVEAMFQVKTQYLNALDNYKRAAQL